MMGFKTFLESEEEDNVKQTISKLPKAHQKLLHGFKVRFTPSNTLKDDNQSVGYIHQNKIVVAAPWAMSRSFVFLHEVSHLIWEKLISPKLKKEWSDLLKSTKAEQIKKLSKESGEALNQNDEEILCMVYANYYTKHKVLTYNHPAWMKFIENLS